MITHTAVPIVVLQKMQISSFGNVEIFFERFLKQLPVKMCFTSSTEFDWPIWMSQLNAVLRLGLNLIAKF